MEITVKNLNNLYKSTFDNVENLSQFLAKNRIDNALDFHYGHRIKIDKQFTNEMYPIPLFRCRLQGIKTEIFLDVYTTKTTWVMLNFTQANKKFYLWI